MINERIGIYLRISSEDRCGDESQSVKNQRTLIYDYIKNKGDLRRIPAEEYVDDGFSGANMNRPGLLRLLADIALSKISVVIVKDFSRLGRSYQDTANLTEVVFPSYKIRLISVNDGYDSLFDKYGSTGLDIRIKSIISDFYGRDLSVKIRQAKRLRAEKGDFSAPFAPFGYKKSPCDKRRLIIDEEAAKVVGKIFYLREEGYKAEEIASVLNRAGTPTPLDYRENATGRKWNKQTVLRILRNPCYKGTLISHKTEAVDRGRKKRRAVDRKDWFIRENAHEPIHSRGN